MTERIQENTPLLRLELKRADAAELVSSDRTLAGSAFVRALGSRASEVLAKGTVRRYPDRVIVFQQNDEGTSLFLVLAGEARLYARKHSDTVELGVAHKGDVLGEAEVLSGCCSRQSSVIAQGQLDLVELSREALMPGRALTSALQAALGEIHRDRSAKLDEMTDFLNRW